MPVSIRGKVEKYGELPSLVYDAGSLSFGELIARHEGKHIQLTISVKEIP
jgi:hypothetical protein